MTIGAQMFKIKQNDTSPELGAILKDASGKPVNVTGSTVVLNMRLRSSGEIKVNRGPCDIVDGVAGSVKYPWQVGDTDTPGVYEAEYEVTYIAGGVETFPNDGYKHVKVGDDIA